MNGKILWMDFAFATWLHIKTINMYLTIVFHAQLFPDLKLTTINMKRDTLIEHNGLKGLLSNEKQRFNKTYNDY
jgi:hypothetical protein